jgi:hypothetical protein
MTLVERASKIREDLQKLPSETIQQNREFFNEVWNFCGAVIDATQDGGQMSPSESLT